MRALVAAVLFAAAAGSVVAAPEAVLRRGEEVYQRCAGCHAIEGNRTGPQHCGIFGRRAGAAPGFAAYSAAMRNARIVWNERELTAFLRDPAARVPGTTMGYAGVKDKQERADLVAWLKQATQPGSCRLQP
jgi:cytochrome c